MPQVQTEEDERDAMVLEFGYLSGLALRATGKLPHVVVMMFDRDGGINIAAMSTRDIARVCEDIRDEFPGLRAQFAGENEGRSS